MQASETLKTNAMTYIDLPEGNTRKLSFYLAMEEYVARSLNQGGDCFFMWQVEPSVIFGRNQIVENEVNIAYCREHGIRMFRRKSGGGCVYADMSNVMLSYITDEGSVDDTFARYMTMITEALNQMGIAASMNDRNDIMIGQQKVSGNAIYHLRGRNIAHGTLLYDTDMEHMLQAITPSRQKLDKHGVESVRQRIGLLKDYTQLPFATIRQQLRHHLCSRTYEMTAEDIRRTEEIEKEYLDERFIFGK